MDLPMRPRGGVEFAVEDRRKRGDLLAVASHKHHQDIPSARAKARVVSETRDARRAATRGDRLLDWAALRPAGPDWRAGSALAGLRSRRGSSAAKRCDHARLVAHDRIELGAEAAPFQEFAGLADVRDPMGFVPHRAWRDTVVEVSE